MEQNQNPPIVGSDCSARSEALPYRSTRWNRDRLYDFELNGGGRACLADRQITDCDRIAFALRELSVLRYDVEPLWVDWTKPRLISSFEDSLLTCYGRRRETRLQRHLKSMYRRVRAVQPLEIDTLYTLYRAELMWRHPRIPFLREPYVFMFNGDPSVIEAVFQAVGFATRLQKDAVDPGPAASYSIGVAPPRMVLSKFAT